MSLPPVCVIVHIGTALAGPESNDSNKDGTTRTMGSEAGQVPAEEGGLDPVEEHHELVPHRHLQHLMELVRYFLKCNYRPAAACRGLPRRCRPGSGSSGPGLTDPHTLSNGRRIRAASLGRRSHSLGRRPASPGLLSTCGQGAPSWPVTNSPVTIWRLHPPSLVFLAAGRLTLGVGGPGPRCLRPTLRG